MYVVDKKTDIVGLFVSDTEMMELDQNKFDSLFSVNRKASNDFSLNTGDSTSGQLTKKFTDLGLQVYLLETTSDKEINARQYRDSAIMASASGGWTKDYQKPLMTDHIINSSWGDTPSMLGRVKDSYYVRRDNGKVMASTKNDLPNQVKAHFLDKEKTGTGFNILKCDINDKGVQNIIDREFVTFSQGSVYTKAGCNVCGNSYYHEDCNHRIGETYEKDGKSIKCIPILDGRRPVEISRVYNPANDTSQKVVYNTKTGKILSDDEVIDLLNDTTAPGSNDNQGEVDAMETNDSQNTETQGNQSSDNNNTGGGIVVNALLKNAIVDNAELQLDKVANDAFKAKVLEVLDEAKTEDELEIVRKLVKLVGNATTEDFKFEAYKPTSDNGEEEANTEDQSTTGQTAGGQAEDNQEIDMANMTDEQKTAFEKMKKDLAEANEKIKGLNNSDSNNPFSQKTDGQGTDTQGAENQQQRNDSITPETDTVLEFLGY